ncbi:MAG: exo-alpha-sialidase, partial [Phycisphaerales bacterium]
MHASKLLLAFLVLAGIAVPFPSHTQAQVWCVGDDTAVQSASAGRLPCHREVLDDPPIPRPAEPLPGVARHAGPRIRGPYQNIQVNVDEQGHNILRDAANEPSIAIDPANPNRIVIGWRQFDMVVSNFRQAGWAYSHDGGQTWTFPGVLEPGVFRSDPVLDADADGNIYYYSLTHERSCDLFKSIDGGVTWEEPTPGFGGDKAWMTIDRTGGIGRGNIYANWTSGFGICDPGHFTRSYDGGQTFMDCTEVLGYPYWGTLAVGPDGELYVAGDGFVVAKSTTVQDQTHPIAWDFSTVVSLGGRMSFGSGPNPGGLLGQVWIAVDHSDG